MSSVWLTANAVRYMICKLLRARASQGLLTLSWPKSGSRSPRAGSSSARSANFRRLFARDDVDLVRKILPPVFARIDEQHQRRADLQVVAVDQLVLVLQALTVDEGAIGAAQIRNDARGAVIPNLRVAARSLGIVNLKLVRGVAPRPSDPSSRSKSAPWSRPRIT